MYTMIYFIYNTLPPYLSSICLQVHRTYIFLDPNTLSSKCNSAQFLFVWVIKDVLIPFGATDLRCEAFTLLVSLARGHFDLAILSGRMQWGGWDGADGGKMKLNDLALSINIGDERLCHQCAAKQAGGDALGLSKALSKRGRKKHSRKLVEKEVKKQ